MAIDPPEKKRKRKRKLRTAGDEETPNASKIKANPSQSEALPLEEAPPSLPALTESEPENPTPKTEEKDDFASFYLRQVATEFQEDLDKIRSAPDFKDSSIPILVDALRQGQSIFSDNDKRGVMAVGDKLED